MTQDKTCYTSNITEHQTKECTKKRNNLGKYNERRYTYTERELKRMMGKDEKVKIIQSRKSSYDKSIN